MSNSNFQDVVVLNSNTLTIGVQSLILGTDAGSKSIIFAQDPAQASAIFLVASNPTTQNTLLLMGVNRTIGLITGIEVSGFTLSNGSISIRGTSGLVMSANGATITMALSRLSAYSQGDYEATVAQTISTSKTIAAGATSTTTISTGVASALRMALVAPMNITYLDPLGQQQFEASAHGTVGTWTLSASVTWFAGIYTMNGSTASVASSKSNSSSFSLSAGGGASGSSSVGLDGRFTNITWDFTQGDYLLIFGSSIKASFSRNSTTPVHTLAISILQTTFGAIRAQVSYSVPYFGDGTVSTSAGSYALSNIGQSGGTNATSVAPRIHFLGT